jgi:hypothetical protein
MKVTGFPARWETAFAMRPNRESLGKGGDEAERD